MTAQELLRFIWNEAATLNSADEDEVENGLRRIAELARADIEHREPAEWALPST